MPEIRDGGARPNRAQTVTDDSEGRDVAVRKRQLTRDDWVEAARKALVAGGVDDVKVDRLATKLKVTRGSFYWHFKHRKDLLDAVLGRWEQQNLAEIEEVRERARTSPNKPMEVARIWLSEEAAFPTFDMAVRFWARKSKPVAKLVREIDNLWIEVIRSLFDEADDPRETLARARIIYFHQIGYYALAMDETYEERLAMLPAYNRILVGETGGRREALDALVEELRANAQRKGKTRGAG